MDRSTSMATRKITLRRIALATAAAGVLLSGCVSPVAGPNGRYATPIGNAPVTANPTPYSAALVLPWRIRPQQPAAVAPHRGRPHQRLHRQGRGRGRPQDHPGRVPDGHLGPGQGRRPTGRALRHLGLRARAQIRQQPARHRRRRRGAGRPADPLSPHRGRPGAGFRLLPRRRHHRAELQHPLRRHRRQRRRGRRPRGSRAAFTRACSS